MPAPKSFCAPRGSRDPETGRWQWPLWGRPDSAYSGDFEREVVAALRELVGRLVDAREEAGLSLRQMSRATGVSLSVLTGMEQGSAWPRLSTATAVAGATGRQVCVDGRADVVEAVLARGREARRSEHKLAMAAGLRPQTVYALREADRKLSLETLMRLSTTAGATWSLEP